MFSFTLSSLVFTNHSLGRKLSEQCVGEVIPACIYRTWWEGGLVWPAVSH